MSPHPDIADRPSGYSGRLLPEPIQREILARLARKERLRGIAKALNVSKKTVQNVQKRGLVPKKQASQTHRAQGTPPPAPEVLEALKLERAEAWGAKEELILEQLTPDKLKGMSGAQLASAADIAGDLHRKYRGFDKDADSRLKVHLPATLLKPIEQAILAATLNHQHKSPKPVTPDSPSGAGTPKGAE